jgi:choice-of-anchor A domain-containing protein
MRAFQTFALAAALLSLTACGLMGPGDDSQGAGAESSGHLDDTGACPPDSSAVTVRLNDYNVFLLGDYNLGTDVEGKVAAAGNITMDTFAVGWKVPAADLANTLVAGGNLTLSNGGVWGDAWHGGNYSADGTVVQMRGAVAQGSPIDFTARGAQLLSLSTQLASLTANGTTTRETWGGLMLRGADAQRNVFDVNASDLTGATLWSIQAPAGSFVVVNIRGSSATISGGGIQFSGGIDQHGVLYNFVDTTSITAQGFGFWGTVLAPRADIHFTNGSFDGGIYAKSLTGNAEGHVNPLDEHSICQVPPPPPPGEPDGGSGGGTPDGGSGGGTPDGGSGGGTPDGGNGGGTPDGGNGDTPDGGNGGGTPDGGNGGHDGGSDDGDDDDGGGGSCDGVGSPGADLGTSLWPPNHKYVDIALSDCAGPAHDSCGGTLPVDQYGTILGVSSDEVEDANGNGDGHTCEDIVISADGKSVKVRAEREGTGDGRVYSVRYAINAPDGTIQSTCHVYVPHDMSDNHPVVDSGVHYCVGQGCPPDTGGSAICQ